MTAPVQQGDLANAERTHAIFRGSAEVGKLLTTISLIADVSAACLALYALLPGQKTIWLPAVGLSLVLTSVTLRYLTRDVRQIAERARRAAFKAFALGQRDVPPAILSSLQSDAPWLALAMSRRLPAASLADYYEPTVPAGPPRQRELVAYSAFYTWRLLRARCWILLVLTVALSAAVFLVFYSLAEGEATREVRRLVLDGMCSVVLSMLVVRAVEGLIAAARDSRDLRSVADRLIAEPLPDGDRLQELVEEYDFLVANTPAPPTLLYRAMRTNLDREWATRRKALVI